MGELSLLASVRADVCRLWKCPVPSEQQEREGHRHLGAETEGRAGHRARFCFVPLRKWGPCSPGRGRDQQGLGAELVVTAD